MRRRAPWRSTTGTHARTAARTTGRRPFARLSRLRREGVNVPQFLLLLGLNNGPNTSIAAIREGA
jgi:hypothetical protein